jgi:hypothetical protein
MIAPSSTSRADPFTGVAYPSVRIAVTALVPSAVPMTTTTSAVGDSTLGHKLRAGRPFRDEVAPQDYYRICRIDSIQLPTPDPMPATRWTPDATRPDEAVSPSVCPPSSQRAVTRKPRTTSIGAGRR